MPVVPRTSWWRPAAPCEDWHACCAPLVVGNPCRRIAAGTLLRRESAVNEPEGSPTRSGDGRPSAGNPLRLMDFLHFAKAPQGDPLVLRLKCRLGIEPDLDH